MGGEWRVTPLGELVEIFDGPHATPGKTESGPVFLGISNLSGGRLDLSDTRHLSEEAFAQWTRRVQPQPGDVVFSYETRLGQAAIVPEGLRCCLGRRMGLLRPKNEHIDSRFLLFAYLGCEFQETLRQQTVQGSTVDRILLSEMGSFPIRVPEIAEQRAIAHILGTLDDKIDLNRQMNETLEEMARAIFRSWFVDFDPVRAKMDGRWRPGESLPGLPAELYELFPERLVESELGEVPEGWGPSPLGDLAVQHRSSVKPKEIPSGTPYIGLEHMPRKSIALSEWGTADGLGSNKYEFDQGQILFGKLRPYFHKVGVTPVGGVCSTDIVVMEPRTPGLFGIVLGCVSSEEFVAYTNAGSTGTKMPRTSWTYMSRFPLALPKEPEPLGEAFLRFSGPIVRRIRQGIHESRTLGNLRDTLLPKLISGELRVPDAERIAERAD